MSEDNHRYSVLIVGISGIAGGPSAAVERLSDKFRLPRHIAEKLVEAIPAVVKKDVVHAEAELYATALREIGAEPRMVRLGASGSPSAAGSGIVTPRRTTSSRAVVQEDAVAEGRASGAHEAGRSTVSSGESVRRPMHIVRSASGGHEAAPETSGQRTVMGSPESMRFRLPSAPSSAPSSAPDSPPEDRVRGVKALENLEDTVECVADTGPYEAAESVEQDEVSPESVKQDEVSPESAGSESVEMAFETGDWNIDAAVEPPVERIAVSSSELTPPSSAFDSEAFALPDSLRSADHPAVGVSPIKAPPVESPAGPPTDLFSESADAFLREATGESARAEDAGGPDAALMARLSGDFGLTEEETVALGPPPPSPGFPGFGGGARPSAFDELMALDDGSSHLPGLDASRVRGARKAPSLTDDSGFPFKGPTDSGGDFSAGGEASPFARPSGDSPRSSSFDSSPFSAPSRAEQDEFSVAKTVPHVSTLVQDFGVLQLPDADNASGLNLQLDTDKPHLSGAHKAVNVRPPWETDARRPTADLPSDGAVDSEPRHPARASSSGGTPGVRPQEAAAGTEAPAGTEAGAAKSGAAKAGAAKSGAAKARAGTPRTRDAKASPARAARPSRKPIDAPVIGGFDAKHERNRRRTQRMVRVLLTLVVLVIAVSGALAAGMLFMRYSAAQDATRFAQGTVYMEHHIGLTGRATGDAPPAPLDAVRACAGDGVAPDLVCRYSREWYASYFPTASAAAMDRAPGACFGHFTEDGDSLRETLDCTLTSSTGEPVRLARLATRECDDSLLELAVGGRTTCRYGASAQLLPKDAEFIAAVDSPVALRVEFRRELELATDVGSVLTREYLLSDDEGPREYHYYAGSLGAFVRQAPLAGAANLRVTYTERDGRSSGVQVWPR